MTKTSDKITASATTTNTATAPATPAAKKRVTKKTTTPAVTVAATTTAPVVAATAATPVVADGAAAATTKTATDAVVDNTLSEQFTVFMAKLQGVGTQFSSLKTEFRALEKRCTRDFKVAQKASTKGKRRSGNREPSGFVKPTIISTELATFLKKPEGTLMARTEVTKEINSYIRANSLQDKTNGRKIIPDGPLTKLLKISKTDELTYFNLQKFMSHHFPKKVVVAVAEEKTA
tara:strand:+ start:2163 stop:2861 length:699 start_codon:yes stop_codon:yes gene_type:complete